MMMMGESAIRTWPVREGVNLLRLLLFLFPLSAIYLSPSRNSWETLTSRALSSHTSPSLQSIYYKRMGGTRKRSRLKEQLMDTASPAAKLLVSECRKGPRNTSIHDVTHRHAMAAAGEALKVSERRTQSPQSTRLDMASSSKPL